MIDMNDPSMKQALRLTEEAVQEQTRLYSSDSEALRLLRRRFGELRGFMERANCYLVKHYQELHEDRETITAALLARADKDDAAGQDDRELSFEPPTFGPAQSAPADPPARLHDQMSPAERRELREAIDFIGKCDMCYGDAALSRERLANMRADQAEEAREAAQSATAPRKDAEEWGNALNEASWKLIECGFPRFNDVKSAARTTILCYFDALAKASLASTTKREGE